MQHLQGGGKGRPVPWREQQDTVHQNPGAHGWVEQQEGQSIAQTPDLLLSWSIAPPKHEGHEVLQGHHYQADQGGGQDQHQQTHPWLQDELQGRV